MNDKFELSDRSSSVSDIQDYFEYTLKKLLNKIANRITFKIKTAYYVELLISEKMKLLGNTKSKIKGWKWKW